MKLRFVFAALKDQLPLKRLLRNTLNGSIRGLFHIRAHENHDGKPKVRYGSKASAVKAAASMAKKKGVHFSNYCCPHCGGYHIGKNQPISDKEMSPS